MRGIAGLVPIGRLDVDLEGLLLFSNDGAFVHRLSHPSFDVEKVYEVTVFGSARNSVLEKLNKGVSLGESIACANVSVIAESCKQGSTILRFVLHQGWNRQIRRMCGQVGLGVLRLKRVEVGKFKLGNIKIGCFEYLGREEVLDYLK